MDSPKTYTGNICHTKHRTKNQKNKPKQKTQHRKLNRRPTWTTGVAWGQILPRQGVSPQKTNMDPTKNPKVNPGANVG